MSPPTSAGYSGTPLSRKLGLTPGCTVLQIKAPPELAALLEPIPDGVRFVKRIGASVDIVHLFATRREELARHLASLRSTARPDASIWVSWPKRASKVPTTITEDVIRDVALPMGFVDVKVCAVSEVWSGLRLVVRKELR